MLVCLLGLVGTPPTAVFVGKLSVFTAAWDAGLAWLVVAAAVNTVASLYYYLRWLAPAVAVRSPDPEAAGSGPIGAPARLVGATVRRRRPQRRGRSRQRPACARVRTVAFLG